MTQRVHRVPSIAVPEVYAPAPRVRGVPWLRLAQGAWLVCAAVVVVIYLLTVPRDWVVGLVPCVVGEPCHRPRLHPREIETLASYGIRFEVYVIASFGLRLLTALLHVLIAGMIFWRKRHDAMALFGAYMLLTLGLTTTSFVFGGGFQHPAWGMLMVVVGIMTETILTFFFALFPTRRFVPRSLRWFAPLLVVANVLLYVFVPAQNNWAYELCIRLFNAVWLGTLGASQIYRYRHVSDIHQRQQTRWVVLGAALGLGFNALLMLVSFTVVSLELDPSRIIIVSLRSMYYTLGLLVPLAFGVAILRDGLYNVDVWVRRGVVGGLLTGCVVALYVVLVGAASAVFRTSDNAVISLVATGVIAVVFQPLHQRLQRGVNRLLYGDRDDPYAVLTRLGQRLAATVATDEVLPVVAATIRDALKLRYVAIRAKEQDGWATLATVGTPTPEPLRLPLVYQHVPVGELVLGGAEPVHSSRIADRRLLTDLAQQVSIALHAASLTRDLQASRARLVTSREEERRRLRRDLHDGLGPSLATLGMQLDTARALMPDNPEAGMALLADTQEQIKDAIGNVRRLVYALRPPSLDQFGLVAAIREHAMREGHRHGLRIVLDAPDVLPPLPAAVEVAAYYIALEAMTNVIRHARASQCIVRLALDHAVQLEVADDGVGLPQSYQAGVGLFSMGERAAELGGATVIEHGTNGGTVVRATLPFAR